MFDNLTNRMSMAFRNIIRCGRLTEDNIKKTLREVRVALLEADVALSVVQNFMQNIKEKSIGHIVNKSLTPGQELIKIVHNELVILMGKENQTLNLSVKSPAIILLTGIKGVGKTTSAGKLGKFLRERYNKKILAVSTDIYRPAAIKQLEILSQQVNIDFFSSNSSQIPIDIASTALKAAKIKCYDVLLVDTAGYMHTDTIKMNEVKKIIDLINPAEILFVVDAMTGQDAINSAQSFNKAFPLTGVLLTKVDSDTRGGAALSIRFAIGKPIKFLGVGEKIDELELFHPNRIASRILGMNDTLSLIEDIERKINSSQIEKFAIKIKKGDNFNLTDLLEQLHHIKNMDGIGNLIVKILGTYYVDDNLKKKIDNKILAQMEAMINSMTLKERMNPNLIKGSRKRRIAAGSGMHVQNVNHLLKQFENIQRMMKKIKKDRSMRLINIMKAIPLNFLKH